MRGKISTGIWFIFFGTIALLHNFDVINFNFWAVLPYWPLLIIALGVNLIFQNKKNGAYIISIVNIVSCLYLGYVGLTSEERFNIPSSINISDPQDTVGALPIVSTPFTQDIENASLQLNIGAVSLTLDSIPSTDLLYASTTNNNIGLQLTRSGDESSPELEINNITKKESTKNNRINFALNDKPIWNIAINMGASTFNADFSKHKLSNLEINAGATTMNLKLGMPYLEECTVDINTGASSFNLNIPKEAACRVEMNSLLSSKKMEGFEKKDGYLQTANYESATKKYIISIAGAANSLKINRY